VAIVSRGYGRSTHGCVVVSDGKRLLVDSDKGGDEPVMLAGQLQGSVVIVAEERFAAAELAVRRYGAKAIVMDDGFQHRSLRRDLNILVVDGSRSLKDESLLPAGLRREWLRSMDRADLVVVTKIARQEQVACVAETLRPWYQGDIVGARTVVRSVLRAGEDGPAAASMPGKPFAFCGIGSPEGFAATLADAGVTVRGAVNFPDHHRYCPDDINSVAEDAKKAGADSLITTEKDAMRLIAAGFMGNSFGVRLPLYWIVAGLEFLDGGALLAARLDKTLLAKSGS